MQLLDEDFRIRIPFYLILANNGNRPLHMLLFNLYHAPRSEYLRSEAFLATASLHPKLGRTSRQIAPRLVLLLAAAFAANCGVTGHVGHVWAGLWGLWRTSHQCIAGVKITERLFLGANPRTRVYDNLDPLVGANTVTLLNVAATLASYPYYCPPHVKARVPRKAIQHVLMYLMFCHSQALVYNTLHVAPEWDCPQAVADALRKLEGIRLRGNASPFLT